MALQNRSLFLYGYTVTSSNNKIDFKAAGGGPQLTATLTQGYYSLYDLLQEVKKQMQVADSLHTYTVTVDRTISSGLQNRVTISTSGAFLSLLFLTGTNTAYTSATLLGYTTTDKTGATTYTGQNTTGTVVETTYVGYSYIPITMMKKTIGSKSISGSGFQETVSFAQHQFFEIEVKYEPQAAVIANWSPLMDWASQGRPLEFTPDVTAGNTTVNCFLEKTSYDGKGLGYKFKEMLPDFPFNYTTGLMTFRVKPVPVIY